MALSMLRSSSRLCSRFAVLRHGREIQSKTKKSSNGEDPGISPLYPPIKPKFPPGKWGSMHPKIAWEWEAQRKEVARFKTVNGKMNFLTDNFFRTWRYNAIDPTPNLLAYQCGVTKTRIIEGALPAVYRNESLGDFDVLNEDVYKNLKQILIGTIIHEEEMNRENVLWRTRVRNAKVGPETDSTDFAMSKLLIKTIVINLLGAVASFGDNVASYHVDNETKVKAFWNRHGFKRRKPRVKVKDFLQQDNTMFYCEHYVECQIRKKNPLPEFISVKDELCNVTSERYQSMEEFSPKVLGQMIVRKKRECTAGYRIGDSRPFNHLSFIFLNRDKLKRMRKYGEEFKKQADVGYALNTSFVSTLAQAHMLGFNEYEELTYPFTTQTILTDGRRFIFCGYQLNTIQLWKDDEANNLQNILWITESKDLYKKYENNKLVGFNDDVCKLLLKFLLMRPLDGSIKKLHPNLKGWPGTERMEIPVRKVYKSYKVEIDYEKERPPQ